LALLLLLLLLLSPLYHYAALFSCVGKRQSRFEIFCPVGEDILLTMNNLIVYYLFTAGVSHRSLLGERR
jgi:hypothetical protein